jgi:hypothetical protein
MAPFTIEEDLDVLEQVTMGDGVVQSRTECLADHASRMEIDEDC